MGGESYYRPNIQKHAALSAFLKSRWMVSGHIRTVFIFLHTQPTLRTNQQDWSMEIALSRFSSTDRMCK